MLQSINFENFAKTIKQTHKTMNEASSIMLIAELEYRLGGGIMAWIEGEDIPGVPYDKYSISKILAYRNSHDYLLAIRFLSEYIKAPIGGKSKYADPFVVDGRRLLNVLSG